MVRIGRKRAVRLVSGGRVGAAPAPDPAPAAAAVDPRHRNRFAGGPLAASFCRLRPAVPQQVPNTTHPRSRIIGAYPVNLLVPPPCSTPTPTPTPPPVRAAAKAAVAAAARSPLRRNLPCLPPPTRAREGVSFSHPLAPVALSRSLPASCSLARSRALSPPPPTPPHPTPLFPSLPVPPSVPPRPVPARSLTRTRPPSLLAHAAIHSARVHSPPFIQRAFTSHVRDTSESRPSHVRITSESHTSHSASCSCPPTAPDTAAALLPPVMRLVHLMVRGWGPSPM